MVVVDAVWAVEEIEIAKIRTSVTTTASRESSSRSGTSCTTRRACLLKQGENLLSINDAPPEEWDAIKADRYYDNRQFDIKDGVVLPIITR